MRAPAAVVGLALAVACGGSGPASTTKDAGGPPARFVGVTSDGSVVLARTADGSVERTIMEPGPGPHRDRSIQLLDDGRTLYVWTGEFGECGSLVRTSVDGGAGVAVLEAVRAWSVSGDGAALAYTDGPYLYAGCGDPLSVVVRDVGDGMEQRWMRRQDPDALGGVVELLWVRAPRYLDWVSCGADTCAPALLDTERTGSLDEATLRDTSNDEASPPTGLGYDWFPSSMAMRGSHGTIVFSVDYSSSDGSETQPIVEADAMTQRVKGILFHAPGGPVDFDATGTYMLFRDERLSWWGGGEDPVAIGGGFVDANW